MMPSSAWPNDSMRRSRGQPSFKVGDMVMIDARHFATKRPSKKLDHKQIGPVRITALIGKRAVRVELPPTMRPGNISKEMKRWRP
jgi:hypothetical protein